jgi:hypothetical protein
MKSKEDRREQVLRGEDLECVNTMNDETESGLVRSHAGGVSTTKQMRSSVVGQRLEGTIK